MCRFVESIRIEDGIVKNKEFHNERLNNTRNEVFGIRDKIDIMDIISNVPEVGIYKYRIIYSNKIEVTECIPYRRRAIKSLKLVYENTIDYSYKYVDKSRIEILFQQRQNCDDILIIKGGLITDTSFSNIIFFDGVKWITPNNPLLRGTMREYLIHNNIIFEEEIKPDRLETFKKTILVNAMIPFDNPLVIKKIVP